MITRPIAHTTAGDLGGCLEDGLYVFRGVPYAEPPVGDLRWRAARPHAGWTGVRDASAYGPSAPQPVEPGGSPILGTHGDPPFDEDCLTLNLWTPNLDGGSRPVLVWIHGGGLLTGSGNLPNYATDTFARDGDLVGISINYRLGPLGFLAGMGDENVWLTDQVEALRWIADNVAAFGGDPNRITLVGQSGGAYSIAALAQHPVARQLFHRAILQSPPFGMQPHTVEESTARTKALARHLGHDDIEALRHEPWERLIQGTIGVLMEHTKFGEWPLAFYPVFDEATIPRHPIESIIDSDIEIIIGWTRDEGTFPFAFDPQVSQADRDQVESWLQKRFGDHAASAYEAHAGDGTSPWTVIANVVGDELFHSAGYRVADERATRRPVRAYQFDVVSPLSDGALGAVHCIEMPFTFANLDRWTGKPFVDGLDPDVVARVTNVLHQAWIAFVRTGDPTHDQLPVWPTFRADDPAVLVVGDEGAEVARDLARPDHVSVRTL
uniref:Phenmedipham hydrolase n=1 Tax=Pseudarthrobacter oxydans TaxID=1671 RepID=PCD_PSEOX|nr:RecName: Full=Phenmedipham hydrolase; AltName: Full=Phenylcarbamate hydrolase [Pseudarthrobacter oxydans]AAA22078.1 phenmedipham hydrolase [Pseudarthrobacter oxydans]